MILVFLFSLLAIIAVVIVLSTISLRLEELHISNLNNESKVKSNYTSYFELYFLNKIKILSIKIDKDRLQKFQIKKKIENIDFKKAKKDMPNSKEMKELISKLKIRLERFGLTLKIGTDDVIITSAIVAFISGIIGIIFGLTIKKYRTDKYKYEILPVYQNKNIIKLDLNCIIKVKMVHIIYVIYVLLKKRRVNKNERASNRRAYDYSYE